MPNKIVSIKASDGTMIQFVQKEPMNGQMKSVYFSPDKKYVVGFFKEKLDYNHLERLRKVVGEYRKKIFDGPGGPYWENLFCWPTKIVEWEGKIGIVCPAYHQNFIFSSGRFKGREKEGKQFASAKIRNKFLEANQKGDWLSYLVICSKIARAVRRLHAAGLAHSDLSYKNILIDPLTASASIIDCDGIVVPGKYPADVYGTPDFIAPEVVETQSLKFGDKNKNMPCRATDLHALAVLVYMYLLYRHPLKGGKIHDKDAARDDELAMGKNALFIEHPTDTSNRPNLKDVHKSELPQADVSRFPYTICGPYLKDLFDKAFIDGLHNPSKRPSAAMWEEMLLKTLDVVLPCQNPKCEGKYFVWDSVEKPCCPFCKTHFKGSIPVFEFYVKRGRSYCKEGTSFLGYHEKRIFKWHVLSNIAPNEKLSAVDKKSVADIYINKGRCYLINRNLPSMSELSSGNKNKAIPPRTMVELTTGKKILLSSDEFGRLIKVDIKTF